VADLAVRVIFAVFVHPDDESLACGGTLARLADLGASLILLLCATHGERGFVSEPALVADADLGRVRTGELRVLGLRTVLLLDHPDGNVRWAHGSRLAVEIASVV
jgi:N-acetylglucosamine malate deacetylase 2